LASVASAVAHPASYHLLASYPASYHLLANSRPLLFLPDLAAVVGANYLVALDLAVLDANYLVVLATLRLAVAAGIHLHLFFLLYYLFGPFAAGLGSRLAVGLGNLLVGLGTLAAGLGTLAAGLGILVAAAVDILVEAGIPADTAAVAQGSLVGTAAADTVVGSSFAPAEGILLVVRMDSFFSTLVVF